MINIYIVDDHKVLSGAIADYLKNYSDIDCIGMAMSAQDALDHIPQSNVDVVLLDIGLPDMNGIECCKRLLKLNPKLKILGLSTHQDVSIVKKLFRAGAMGYLSKATNLDELYQGIVAVYQGEKYMGHVIRNALLLEIQDESISPKTDKYLIPKLTKREKDVLQLIAQEYTTEEIAKELFISKNTVESHRRNLIGKFDVRNSVGLIKKALDFKLV